MCVLANTKLSKCPHKGSARYSKGELYAGKTNYVVNNNQPATTDMR